MATAPVKRTRLGRPSGPVSTERLAALLELHAWGPADLGRRLGVTQQRASQMTRSPRLTLPVRERLARELGVSVEYLAGENVWPGLNGPDTAEVVDALRRRWGPESAESIQRFNSLRLRAEQNRRDGFWPIDPLPLPAAQELAAHRVYTALVRATPAADLAAKMDLLDTAQTLTDLAQLRRALVRGRSADVSRAEAARFARAIRDALVILLGPFEAAREHLDRDAALRLFAILSPRFVRVDKAGKAKAKKPRARKARAK